MTPRAWFSASSRKDQGSGYGWSKEAGIGENAGAGWNNYAGQEGKVPMSVVGLKSELYCAYRGGYKNGRAHSCLP